MIEIILLILWAISGWVPVVLYHKKHRNPGWIGLLFFATFMGPCMIIEAIQFDAREKELEKLRELKK